MAKATKSAIATGPYSGDVWSHIVKINTAANYSMFTKDGKEVKSALSLEVRVLALSRRRQQGGILENQELPHHLREVTADPRKRLQSTGVSTRTVSTPFSLQVASARFRPRSGPSRAGLLLEGWIIGCGPGVQPDPALAALAVAVGVAL